MYPLFSRLLRTSVLSLGLALSLTSFALNDTAKTAELKPLDIQSKTSVEIVNQLSEHHYRKQELNDSLSSRFLDEYLKTLDNSKNIFLASDIAEFDKYRKSFDDDFKAGKLNNGFAIYNRFGERYVARLNRVIALLDDKKVQFTFDTDETYNPDRKTAAWPANAEEADKLWMQNIKASLLSSMLGGKTLEESRSNLRKRFVTQLRYFNQQTSEEVFSIIMNSLTMLFDPHTNYLSPDNSQNFTTSMTNKFEGIGAELKTDEDYTKVARLIPASPAEKQGQLKPNDKIVGVAQGEKGEFEDIIGWRLTDVVKKIKGPKGTIVRLEVIAADPTVTQHKIISIKRDTIELEEQKAKKAILNVKNGTQNLKLGVIDIPVFYGNFDPNSSVGRDVYRLLQELRQENIDGLILDLRENGGGSLPEAATLTNLFVDPGPVVQIRQADDVISRDVRAVVPAVYRGPLIVLINRFSASASEIFAGAIQDYGRGLVVGSTTWGKGSVQSYMPIDKGEGNIKITQAKFYRISGDSTQHRGVIPDIELPSLVDTKELGESAYDNALPWDQIRAAPHDVYFNMKDILPALKPAHEERMKADPEFVYLKQQAALYEELNSKKAVSLKLSVRQQEQQKTEQRTLEIENQKRKAKGEPTYANYADYKAKELKKDEDESAAPKKKEFEPEKDPYLVETGKILGDFILQTKKQVAQKAVP
ncbi:carboxy terminal-processing peptidase [Cellvibrio sp.]|uniref:carboxy terminal-processing peptidase n=1 Tax=Cellvibrio sp. TaxID=1965322 RepID=UPI00396485D4